MKKQKVKAPKLPKGVDQAFVDNIQSMSTDQLKAEIVKLQLGNQENEEFKAGEKYQEAKDVFDNAKGRFDMVAGPVKDVSVAIKNKTKLVIERLKEKGGA